jgi:hypothetical protein
MTIFLSGTGLLAAVPLLGWWHQLKAAVAGKFVASMCSWGRPCRTAGLFFLIGPPALVVANTALRRITREGRSA